MISIRRYLVCDLCAAEVEVDRGPETPASQAHPSGWRGYHVGRSSRHACPSCADALDWSAYEARLAEHRAMERQVHEARIAAGDRAAAAAWEALGYEAPPPWPQDPIAAELARRAL